MLNLLAKVSVRSRRVAGLLPGLSGCRSVAQGEMLGLVWSGLIISAACSHGRWSTMTIIASYARSRVRSSSKWKSMSDQLRVCNDGE